MATGKIYSMLGFTGTPTTAAALATHKMLPATWTASPGGSHAYLRTNGRIDPAKLADHVLTLPDGPICLDLEDYDPTTYFTVQSKEEAMEKWRAQQVAVDACKAALRKRGRFATANQVGLYRWPSPNNQNYHRYWASIGLAEYQVKIPQLDIAEELAIEQAKGVTLLMPTCYNYYGITQSATCADWKYVVDQDVEFGKRTGLPSIPLWCPTVHPSVDPAEGWNDVTSAAIQIDYLLSKFGCMAIWGFYADGSAPLAAQWNDFVASDIYPLIQARGIV